MGPGRTSTPPPCASRRATEEGAQEIEQCISLSVLPVKTFDAFRAADQTVPGLAHAAEASKGLLKDAD